MLNPFRKLIIMYERMFGYFSRLLAELSLGDRNSDCWCSVVIFLVVRYFGGNYMVLHESSLTVVER